MGRTPWHDAEADRLLTAERWVGNVRRELLNHVIVLNQRHLNGLLKEYIREYYHVARPHQGLIGDTPVDQEQPLQLS